MTIQNYGTHILKKLGQYILQVTGMTPQCKLHMLTTTTKRQQGFNISTKQCLDKLSN